MALGARHAGRRLVEQQHLGLQAERDGKLDQPLAAVGQFRNGLVRDVGELEPRQKLHRLVDHVAARARGRDHVRRGADALGDRHVDVLQHREAAEQPVDLEGAGDAALDALGLLDLGDVLALEQHLAGARRQHAGQQIDEGGLAGAVRADQRVARAFLQREGDVARGAERAEALAERARFEQRGHGGVFSRCRHRCIRLSTMPRMPPRANSAMTTSSRPRPSCQAVG